MKSSNSASKDFSWIDIIHALYVFSAVRESLSTCAEENITPRKMARTPDLIDIFSSSPGRGSLKGTQASVEEFFSCKILSTPAAATTKYFTLHDIMKIYSGEPVLCLESF
jgi:hypothetical protein